MPRAIAALSGGALAGGIGTAVSRGYTTDLNHAVRRRIHPKRSGRLISVATGISSLVGPYAHPLAASALGFLIHRNERSAGLGPPAASLGAIVVDNVTRLFVKQRRPRGAGSHHGRYRYGYPSGHATAATAISIATAAEIADQLSPDERKVLWTAVIVFSICVGWSRLYLDEHWLDDVVGGWMAGAAIGLGAASLVAHRE